MKDKTVRRWLARYENLIMIAVLIGLFIAVGVYFLQRKDMSMGVWKTDFSKSAIDMDQLIDGGMGRDGILPIDDPIFVPVATPWHAGRRLEEHHPDAPGADGRFGKVRAKVPTGTARGRRA